MTAYGAGNLSNTNAHERDAETRHPAKSWVSCSCCCCRIETAKGHGIEPYAYLRHIFKELPLAESVDDIDALLPQSIKGVVS